MSQSISGTYPRTPFYGLWDQSQNLNFFALGSELPYFRLGLRMGCMHGIADRKAHKFVLVLSANKGCS